jgi:protein regulator of cytokinesis 1
VFEESSFLTNILIILFFQIKEEIRRCLEIRKANIRPLLAAERKRIEGLWNILTLTEAERVYFEPFFSEVVSEDILNLHEFEVERLEQLYNKNR